MSTTTEIAIVGGGPGGLTLARVLQVHGLDAVVHEADASPAAREQNGSLDLHRESGQRALQEAGILDEFRRLARPEGADLRILDHRGALLVDKRTPPDAFERPEIDRAGLVTLLRDALAPGTIAWGRRLTGARRVTDGWALHFEDGTTTHARLLVGADGASSRVREQLTDAVAAYTGSTSLELELDGAAPEAAIVGRGSLWAVGHARTLAAQRLAGGRVRVALTMQVSEQWSGTRDIDRATVLALLDGWAPELRALVAACAADVVARRTRALPRGLRWDPARGVTLLGDAAHLMPPVGEGANQAMLDGALLGRALAAGQPIAAYEREMFARTAAIADDCAQIEALVVSPDGPGALVRMFGAS
jgi:2-polyprenyl-6-methoxyphenol hydroxylase-like FAD-dependent oxidoreductase